MINNYLDNLYNKEILPREESEQMSEKKLNSIK